MQHEGWDLAVGLTDLTLRANRRPVIAHASAMYGVGLLSVPALGARSVPRRAMRAVVNLVEGLLGEEVGRGGDAGETGRAHRMRQRLDELRSPLGRTHADEDGTIAFVGATLRGNLRLLVGMVRANQAARVIARLSSALAVSLGDRRLRDELLQHLDALSRDGVAAPRPPRSGVDHHVVRGPGAGTRLMGAGVRAEGPRSRRPVQPHDVRDSGARVLTF